MDYTSTCPEDERVVRSSRVTWLQCSGLVAVCTSSHCWSSIVVDFDLLDCSGWLVLILPRRRSSRASRPVDEQRLCCLVQHTTQWAELQSRNYFQLGDWHWQRLLIEFFCCLLCEIDNWVIDLSKQLAEYILYRKFSVLCIDTILYIQWYLVREHTCVLLGSLHCWVLSLYYWFELHVPITVLYMQ